MDTLLITAIIIIILNWFLEFTATFLNFRNLTPEIPKNLIDITNEETYKKTIAYTKTKSLFSLTKETIFTAIFLLFIYFKGFSKLDIILQKFDLNELQIGILYILILAAINLILSFPFDLYFTFIIEEKFGFNKTTLKVFLLDRFKGIIIGGILGTGILALILYFLIQTGNNAWLYCWGSMITFQILLMYFIPTLIMPLFNKFTALKDGELKQAINDYASKQNFPLQEVYTMDGSRRSTKANAYFTGLGKNKRIVLYDTLIEQNTTDELVAILAHEMGHFKKGHIKKLIIASIINTGIMFYLLNLVITYEDFSIAFNMKQTAYSSLIIFFIFYSPISTLTSILMNYFSRKYEFEADAYSIKTLGKKNLLANALKKLNTLSMANLTPHPLKIILEYSHPPLIARLKSIQNAESAL